MWSWSCDTGYHMFTVSTCIWSLSQPGDCGSLTYRCIILYDWVRLWMQAVYVRVYVHTCCVDWEPCMSPLHRPELSNVVVWLYSIDHICFCVLWVRFAAVTTWHSLGMTVLLWRCSGCYGIHKLCLHTYHISVHTEGMPRPHKAFIQSHAPIRFHYICLPSQALSTSLQSVVEGVL